MKTVNQSEIKVRYSETDQMGVVYHTNYLVWCEIGRTNLISQLGFDYVEMEAQGYLAPVLDVQLQYKFPLRYGQSAIVKTWVAAYDGLRTTYGYEIRVKETDQLALTATTTHAIVTKEHFKPASFRRHFPEWDKGYKKEVE
ncbi:acyl-CoA thioesterase [Brochothrix campestris]|uniref:Thioesterase domain-containing protein n=1 Tax=Brochothrix campestris FSL F6-1037 TaxID=1265861 RepID=W7CYZ9_9LIST|nr:thioesterase family protein [Brochothrix campestris]EUJ42192.1 hypothetical protein BCAMP_00295 [Brochothrix campestris FSL F6-1037]